MAFLFVNAKHDKLLSALGDYPRSFAEVPAPKGAAKAWDSYSRRGWRHFEDLRTSKGARRADPLFVLRGPGLLLMPMASYKLLNGGMEPSSWYGRPEAERSWRIGRREYVPVSVTDLLSLADSNCRDDFLTREDSARNAAEGLEIAAFGLGLLGRTWTAAELLPALLSASAASKASAEAADAALRAETAALWPPAVGAIYIERRPVTPYAPEWLLAEREGPPPGSPVEECRWTTAVRVLSVDGDTARVRRLNYKGDSVEEGDLEREEWDRGGYAVSDNHLKGL